MRLRGALVALAVLLVGMSPAAAAPTTVSVLVVDGRGWGHGVGMAQDGAMTMGRAGATTAQILGHFYPGTAIGKATGDVRVVVTGGAGADADLSFPGGGEIRDARDGQQSAGFPVAVGPGVSVHLHFDGQIYSVEGGQPPTAAPATAGHGPTTTATTTTTTGAAPGSNSPGPPATSNLEGGILQVRSAGAASGAASGAAAAAAPAAAPTDEPTTTALPASTTTAVSTTVTTDGLTSSTTLDGGTTTTTPPSGPPSTSPAGVPTAASTSTTQALRTTAGTRATSTRTLWAVPSGSAGVVTVASRGRSYRGMVEAAAAGADLRLLNQVDVETYLRGMGEVRNPSWPPAALRTQAIAARTYALRAMAASGEICDYDRCQVYLGAQAEYPAMDKVVSDSARQVVMFGKGLASTVYSANAGGFSATPQEGFGSASPASPYLQASPYKSDNPMPWTVKIALTDVAARLGYKGQVRDVRVATAGPSVRSDGTGW